jgi:type IV secretion system protein VirB11
VGGHVERHDAPELTDTTLWRLAGQIAAAAHQGISREHPLLAATLPGGERVQIVAPPATRGPMAIAIRKQVVADLGLDDYAAAGAFASVRGVDMDDEHDEDAELHAALARKDMPGFLRMAVQRRKNIIVSGGTSTGKTTFLNALVKEIPERERLILIEDTPEVRLVHPNAVGLIAARGGQGEARVGVEDLLQATLRMRPDRIILGELRGPEAYSFLRAVNSATPARSPPSTPTAPAPPSTRSP